MNEGVVVKFELSRERESACERGIKINFSGFFIEVPPHLFIVQRALLPLEGVE